MTDLWPDDIQVVKVKAPVTILREQASLLGQRTKNIVRAEVHVVAGLHFHPFVFSFHIVGPALGNYRYKLFEIRHGIELYPARIALDDEESVKEIFPWITNSGRVVEAGSEEEFMEYLRRIFESQKTRRVIGAILAQSGVEPGETP